MEVNLVKKCQTDGTVLPEQTEPAVKSSELPSGLDCQCLHFKSSGDKVSMRFKLELYTLT